MPLDPVMLGIFFKALEACQRLPHHLDMFLDDLKLLLPRRYARPLILLTLADRQGVPRVIFI